MRVPTAPLCCLHQSESGIRFSWQRFPFQAPGNHWHTTKNYPSVPRSIYRDFQLRAMWGRARWIVWFDNVRQTRMHSGSECIQCRHGGGSWSHDCQDIIGWVIRWGALCKAFDFADISNWCPRSMNTMSYSQLWPSLKRRRKKWASTPTGKRPRCNPQVISFHGHQTLQLGTRLLEVVEKFQYLGRVNSRVLQQQSGDTALGNGSSWLVACLAARRKTSGETA